MKKKMFIWKVIDMNCNYVEVHIPHITYARAENALIKTCIRANLTPIEYLGWQAHK